MKQVESLAEPLFSNGVAFHGDSIFKKYNICRGCKLQFPKSEIRCDDCGHLLASKPRTRKKRVRH